MNLPQLFLQRYDVLYDFYLGGIWEMVPADWMRQRPDPRVNSIAWILWHLARVEDAGINRFVVDRPQVLDDEPWMQRMNVPWRHNGSGMTSPEVDDLSRRIDLATLREYSAAIRARTTDVIQQLDWDDLDEILTPQRVQAVVIDEGLAHSHVDELVANYTGWTKGRALMNFGMTHPYQHVGEIEVIGSLLGVDWG